MSFVESATLRLIDQTSPKVTSINNSLNKLFATAGRLNNMRVNVRLNVTGLQQGQASVNQLIRTLNAPINASNLSRAINRIANINTGQLASATGQVRQLAGAMQQLANAQGRLGQGLNFGNAAGQISAMTRAMQQFNQAQNRAAQPGQPGSSRWGWLGNRPGFSPNGSIVDRVQNRAVNRVERSIGEGALGVDKARTYLSLLGLNKTDLAAGEKYAAESQNKYREMTRGEILQLYGEIGTNFKDPKEALKLMPALQEVVRAGILNGEDSKKAQDGLVQLVRGLGNMSKLTDDNGKLSMAYRNDQYGNKVPVLDEQGRHLSDAELALEQYKRAKVIGGVDVNAREFSQFAKYSRTAGQTISNDALLLSLLSMPDLRGSSYGNALQGMITQLTGRSTKEAQANQAAAGIVEGQIEKTTPRGPGKFMRKSTIDESLLRSDPHVWFYKNFMGIGLEPGKKAVLEKEGIDISKPIDPAKLATVLGKYFSNRVPEQLANMIVNQRGELMTMQERAKNLDISPERLQSLADSSLNMQLQQAGQSLASTLGDIAEKLKAAILPTLALFTGANKKIGGSLDDGNGGGMSPWLVGAGTLAVGAGSLYAGYRGLQWWRGGGPPPGGIPPMGGTVPNIPGGGGAAAAAGAAGAAAAAATTGAAAATTKSVVDRVLGPPGKGRMLSGAMLGLSAYQLAGTMIQYDPKQPMGAPGNRAVVDGTLQNSAMLGFSIASPVGSLIFAAADMWANAMTDNVKKWFADQRANGQVETLLGPKPDETVRRQAEIIADGITANGRAAATVKGIGGTAAELAADAAAAAQRVAAGAPVTTGPSAMPGAADNYRWLDSFGPGGDISQVFTSGAEAVRSAGTDAASSIQQGGAGIASQIIDALSSGASTVGAAISNALSQGVNVKVEGGPGARGAPTGVQQPATQ